ncbi:hypothetical protein [Tenacibaculum singaporense]|uniref:hypothetical protein n=1 Tax=Tenacibaculum TaxID=104267 RepID=UPI0035125DE0
MSKLENLKKFKIAKEEAKSINGGNVDPQALVCFAYRNYLGKYERCRSGYRCIEDDIRDYVQLFC